MNSTNSVTWISRTLATAALTGATLVGGLSAPALAADDLPAAPSMTCAELWASLPARLQRDITDARTLAAYPQHVAMRAIRQSAQHGGYGEAVEKLADERQERRRDIWAVAPEQFRADVRSAQSLPFHQQRRAMRVIRRAALAGVYGEGVQHVAEVRQDWFQTCPKSGDAI